MSIIEAWENSRMSYQQRYVRFFSKFSETGRDEDKGHMLEASYVLISIFACQYSRYKNWSITTAD